MSQPIFVDPVLDGAADPTVIWNAGTQRMVDVLHQPPRRPWRDRASSGSTARPSASRPRPMAGPGPIAARRRARCRRQRRPQHALGAGGDSRRRRLPHVPQLHRRRARSASRHRCAASLHLTSPDLETWTHHGAVDAALAQPHRRLRRPLPRRQLAALVQGRGATARAPGRRPATISSTGPRARGHPRQATRAAMPHEGPNVFELGGHYLDDRRRVARPGGVPLRPTRRPGSGRASSSMQPGSDPMDRRFARHADVVPQGDWAALYYFTHPHGTKPQSRGR